MATPLHDLLRSITSEPAIRAEFAAAPEQFLTDHGWAGLSGTDAMTALRALIDESSLEEALPLAAASPTDDGGDGAGFMTELVTTLDSGGSFPAAENLNGTDPGLPWLSPDPAALDSDPSHQAAALFSDRSPDPDALDDPPAGPDLEVASTVGTDIDLDQEVDVDTDLDVGGNGPADSGAGGSGWAESAPLPDSFGSSNETIAPDPRAEPGPSTEPGASGDAFTVDPFTADHPDSDPGIDPNFTVDDIDGHHDPMERADEPILPDPIDRPDTTLGPDHLEDQEPQ